MQEKWNRCYNYIFYIVKTIFFQIPGIRIFQSWQRIFPCFDTDFVILEKTDGQTFTLWAGRFHDVLLIPSELEVKRCHVP